MTRPIRIWTSAAWHAAFRCGGWAAVREVGGRLAGAAGGERYTTERRMALAGLAFALDGLPAAEPVEIFTDSADLAALGGFLAGLGEATPAAGPAEDLDLWARIAAAANGRRLAVRRTPAEPRTPIAFAAAWAELARDKAKASGPFTSPIPKANLAKMPGLESA